MKKNKKYSIIPALLRMWRTTKHELFPVIDDFLDAEGKYPFELFYADGHRSWKPIPHKRPWGIVIGSIAFRLKVSDERYNWDDAQLYCKKICINGKVASCGSLATWEKIIQLDEKDFLLLNRFISFLDGDRMSPSTFWSASSATPFQAFAIKLGKQKATSRLSKCFNFFEVRPVIEGI